MMIKVGITGNIGSGKTTVCRIFESLGIPVYYADKEAKKFYGAKDVILSVKQVFGEDVFDKDDKLRSQVLADLAFNDPVKLKQLNGIIHPLVLDDLFTWAEGQRAERYILYESALLFESGFISHFDKSILVTAPRALALSRVMNRDRISESEFNARAGKQMTEEKKEKLADHIIINDEDKALIPQVMELHDQLCNDADRR